MKTSKDFELSKKPKVRRKRKKFSPTSLSKIHQDNDKLERVPVENPTRPYFGVLGIGKLGSTIVINLIKMGMKVYIWNRTREKCQRLIEDLDHVSRSKVDICHLPGLVMQRSDIIFNCISDSLGSKAVIEGTLMSEYISDNFMASKGLVDMSGVDPETQISLCEMVTKKGGKYLEVRIQFKDQMSDGGYIFLVGGCEYVLAACQNCFTFLGATTIYLGPKIG